MRFKIEFQEYSVSNWVDWTDYLVDISDVEYKLESEDVTSGGIMLFDSLKMSLKYEYNNAVYNKFYNLTNAGIYLIKVKILDSVNTEHQIFEGIVDFESLEMNEGEEIIHLELLDKLSALRKLAATNARAKNISVATRVSLPPGYDVYFMKSGVNIIDVNVLQGPVNSPTAMANTPANAFTPGEIIEYYDGSSAEYRSLLVKEFWTETDDYNNDPNLRYTKGVIQYVDNYSFPTSPVLMNSAQGWEKNFYSVDCYKAGTGVYGPNVRGFDAVKMIEAILKQKWNVTLTLKGITEKIIPLEHYEDTLDDRPLGSDLVSALKYLAETCDSYLYFGQNSYPTLQARGSLATSGTTRTLIDESILSEKLQYYFARKADAVEVTVKSWLKDSNGNKLEGSYTWQENTGATPVNKMSRTIICDDATASSQSDLDNLAMQKALSLSSFYAQHHRAFKYKYKIDDNSISFSLLDNVSNDKYFDSLRIDFVKGVAEFTLVEINDVKFLYNLSTPQQ